MTETIYKKEYTSPELWITEWRLTDVILSSSSLVEQYTQYVDDGGDWGSLDP